MSLSASGIHSTAAYHARDFAAHHTDEEIRSELARLDRCWERGGIHPKNATWTHSTEVTLKEILDQRNLIK